MTQIPLYIGNGVTLSPINAEGRVLSKYVRIVADEGKAITNGQVICAIKDILISDLDKWQDCESVEPDDLEDAEALEILLGGVE